MTLPNDDIPWTAITAWFAGKLPAAEAARLEAWIAENPEHRKFVDSMRLLWNGAAAARPEWNTRSALAAIKARGGRPKVFTLAPRSAPKPGAVRWWQRGLAAAAVAGLLGGGWWLASSASRTMPTGAPRAVTSSTMTRYAALRGQRLALKLPDGSGVMLGPESVLRYSEMYGKRSRVVELQGEAYFQVTHDAARPFEVRTTYATIRDLGTRFVVRARPASSSVEVAVAEGQVALGHRRAPPPRVPVASADPLVLNRGDWGRVLASGELTSRRGVALDPYFGWTEGRLVFEKADLASVVSELNRWYDVDIQLADRTVGHLQLTATFRDQPITEVLSAIQASLRLELSGAGRQFRLTSR